MSTSSSGSVSAAFRAKASEMKIWKPESPPSNRDRLELFALHKQAVNGDAPTKQPPSASTFIADKAKYNAWRSKRGLSQDEAINLYLLECDRQIRTYGTASSSSTRKEGEKGGTLSSNGRMPMTPTNTPGDEGRGEIYGDYGTQAAAPSTAIDSARRGLAAVPLLCAAASESRTSYLTRMKSTAPSNGWWARQESLCAEPSSICAAPETIVIKIATLVETISLRFGSAVPIPNSVIQAYFWPIHNLLLCIWIMLILLCTVLGSVLLSARTILFGSRSTGVTLDNVLREEIVPCCKLSTLLCHAHYSLSVRLCGMTLTPLVTLTNIVLAIEGIAGRLVCSGVYIFGVVCLWWYWTIALGWLSVIMSLLALGMGWCFALIELANVWVPDHC